MRHWLKLTLQLVLVLFLALAFVCVVVLVQEYGAGHWLPDRRLFYMGTFTGCAFIPVIGEFRRAWGKLQFWLATAALLAVHALAFGVAWRFAVEWRTINYAVIAMAEIPLLVLALDMLGFPRSARHKR